MREIKLNNINDINGLGMYDFFVKDLNGQDDQMVIVGDRGYPHLFRVEILCIDVGYIACIPYFQGWDYVFRNATSEEVEEIQWYADNDTLSVYCIEERAVSEMSTGQQKRRRFFVACKQMLITLYCDEAYQLPPTIES